MTEAAGSALAVRSFPAHTLSAQIPGIKKRRGLLRGVLHLELASNYFDCDFLNMRSIFSFVASQQAWLA
jgi:hypothetical protein